MLTWHVQHCSDHCSDVIMGTIASQITSITIVYSTIYSDADQRKHQSSASLAFVRGIHRGPVNSPHKWPVTWKMFPFDEVIMTSQPGTEVQDTQFASNSNYDENRWWNEPQDGLRSGCFTILCCLLTWYSIWCDIANQILNKLMC